MVWGGRWEGGSGLGTRVHPWQIHVDVWQNQYSIKKKMYLIGDLKFKPLSHELDVNLVMHLYALFMLCFG